MKKKHLVSIWWEVTFGVQRNYAYTGYVTGKQVGEQIIISTDVLFRKLFGYELPAHSITHYG